MKKAISSILLSLVLVACSGGADTVTSTCERLDECNVLGTSVNDCVEELDVALAQATPSDQADWRRLMDSCLEFEGCSTFLNCAGLESNATDDTETTIDPDDEGGGSGPSEPNPAP